MPHEPFPLPFCGSILIALNLALESAVFVDGRRTFLLFLAIAFCQMAFAPRSGAADDTVTIDGGMLKGERSGTVVSFKGIRYAAPPVGDLRWRNPRPAETWSGI